jgi:hypothetical protein
MANADRDRTFNASSPSTGAVPSDSIARAERLPEVEPPSAGFLIQLFVIPGVIVVAIVGVWLLFTWLASDTGDPRTYLEHLRSKTDKRGHAALYLASALADDRHEDLRYDSQFMADMAKVLDDEITEARTEEELVLLRCYLCRALGHFRVASGLPTLIKAAQTQRDVVEVEVRLSALEAISELTDNIRQPLAERHLPQAAAIARKLAESTKSVSGAADVAQRLESAAAAAERIAFAGRQRFDLGAQAGRIAEQFSSLVEAVDRFATSAADHDHVDELRTTVAEMTRQAREAAVVDWHVDSPLAQAILKAANETTEETRFDKLLKRDAPYSHLLRERGAYALGVLGGPEALEKLEQMLSDARPNVAYNAAVSLCRHGAASDKLLKLLDEMIAAPVVKIDAPEAGFSEEVQAQLDANAKQQITTNALRAVDLLRTRSAEANLTPLVGSLEKLIGETEDARLRVEAQTTLDKLKSR